MGFAVASGASPTERLREVDNFFPTNHKFYGFADLFGLRNLVDGHVLGQWKAKAAPLTLTGGLFAFSLYDDRARWSDAVGRTLGHDASCSRRATRSSRRPQERAGSATSSPSTGRTP